MTVSSDGQVVALVTGIYDKEGKVGSVELELWDVASGKTQVLVKDHPQPFGCLAFSPDGKALAAGCDDKTIRLWDVSNSFPKKGEK
jgi:WD40 repeat protein